MTESKNSFAATYREVDAKTVILQRFPVDSWFLCRYGMNLYRGCEHGCIYCDGRAERYYVQGDFERDITIKRNAVQLCERELERAREPGFIHLGGGVCDAYQPAEQRYRLARGILQVALKKSFPVHVLTKSSLVERDFDLLVQINQRARAILAFSLQTVDDSVRARFEPQALPVAERLRLLRKAKDLGLGVGIMAMPVLPGISDRPEQIDRLVAACVDAGADFLCYGGLTLRPGIQKRVYGEVIRADYPQLLEGYRRIYQMERPSGAPDQRYHARVEERFWTALRNHHLPARIPRRLFQGSMPLYTEIAVLLEHCELERRMAGLASNGLSTAGMAIQQWARERLARKKGIYRTYRDVEHEFVGRVADQTITRISGITDQALKQMRQLIDDRDPPARLPVI